MGTQEIVRIQNTYQIHTKEAVNIFQPFPLWGALLCCLKPSFSQVIFIATVALCSRAYYVHTLLSRRQKSAVQVPFVHFLVRIRQMQQIQAAVCVEPGILDSPIMTRMSSLEKWDQEAVVHTHTKVFLKYFPHQLQTEMLYS